MRNPFSIPPRLLRGLNRRLRKARPGSVLILCVALLVLLALIGTAMISTSRVDRYSSVQHTINTEIDLLIQGEKSIAESAIISDLFNTFSTPVYRQPYYPNPNNNLITDNYDHWDMPSIDGINKLGTSTMPPQLDLYLSSRYPELQNPLGTFSANNLFMWKAITAPLTMDPTGALAFTSEFEEPYVNTAAVLSVPNPPAGDAGHIVTNPYATAHYSQRICAVPTAFTIQNGTSSFTVPAIEFVVPGQQPALCQAADADGDGIADCGLVRVPVGPINGVTYYSGVRIVDNNSAINVNSAWSRQYDFGPGNGLPYTTGKDSPSFTASTNLANPSSDISDAIGFYRTNVGLLELLRSFAPSTKTSQEMNALNLFRFGFGAGASSGSASLIPATENGQTFAFTYANQSDALESGLIRRVDNPDMNGTGSTAVPFNDFSLSDQSVLASHFCVRSPTSSASSLENVLSISLMGTGSSGFAHTTGTLSFEYGTVSFAYPAANVNQWYYQNFFWDQNGQGTPTLGANPSIAPNPPPAPMRLPLRSMLVARNPVSNFIPAVALPAPASGTIGVSPLIPFAPTFPVDGRTLPGMAAYTVVPSGAGSVTVAVKTDINTATFPELWRAYWSVMADNSDPTQPPFPASGQVDGVMFRSTVRNTGVGTLTPPEMLQLRSGLAAVNAMALRHYDTDKNQTLTGMGDIISREIPLYTIPSAVANNWTNALPQTAAAAQTNTPAAAFTARIYGTDKQPFVTEVYVNNWTGLQSGGAPSPASNPSGYVAIELFNPYSVPLILNHWTIGIINRAAGGALSIAPLTIGTRPSTIPTGSTLFPSGAYGNDMGYLGGGQIEIPPQTYIVLDNVPPAGITPTGNDAFYRPGSAGTAQPAFCVYVPNLTQVMNNEAVLLRPHFSARPITLPPPAPASPLTTFDSSAATSNLSAYAYHSTTPAIPDQPAVYNEGAVASPNLADFVPVDSYDFTGIAAAGSATTGTAWHYLRANAAKAGAVSPNTSPLWYFVYPGLYYSNTIRPQTESANLTSATNDLDGFKDVNLTLSDSTSTDGGNWPGVQLANVNWAGPNQGALTFPFGAFPRNGDILQVPFIGGYQIRNQALAAAATTFLEMNAVTTDCSFVDDQFRTTSGTRDTDAPGQNDDSQEQLGRFCPIYLTDNSLDDHDITRSYAAGWRYHFAEKLFDYLTVQSPASDYKPNYDPSNPYMGPEIAVQNSSLPVGNESTVGVNGLVNINTAPWWVLASLPLLPNNIAGPDNNNNGIPDNIEDLAKQIVFWRDNTSAATLHGPFRSIMDLNRVTNSAGTLIFQNGLTYYGGASYTQPPDSDGYVSPNGAGNSTLPGDFEKQNLMLDRISNLITNRSDSFTVYIIVQGWKNAGTSTPTLVAQRRAAFIIDRSNVTAVSGAESPKITTVPTD